MSESPEVGKQRRGRMILVYAGLFAALAVVGLACWQWPVGAERWYAYKYEQTQGAEYRAKLEELGAKHPELLLSRWFFLVTSPGSPAPDDKLQALPLHVRQKALGLWLKERLAGNWWNANFPPFYLPQWLEDWRPHFALIKSAFLRLPSPPPENLTRGVTLYELSRVLAELGDDTGLPYLEGMLLKDVGVFPYDEAGITDYGDALIGVVALAAHGNERAQRDIAQGLARLRTRESIAGLMGKVIRDGSGGRSAGHEWLQRRLAAFEQQRAAEQAAAEARHQKLADDIARDSCLASAQERCCMDHALHSYRIRCREGSASAEEMSLTQGGQWSLHRRPIEAADCAACWKDLLAFDLWTLPETDAEPSSRDSSQRIRASFRAGDRQRSVRRDGCALAVIRAPDEPASWIRGFVEERLKTKDGNGIGVRKSGTESSSGTLGRQVPPEPAASIATRWLRGDPWEEIVKAAPEASEKPPPVR